MVAVAPKMLGVNTNDVNAKRIMMMFRFFLDVAKEGECQIAEELAEWRKKRKLQPTIRQALRLFIDLQAGKTDVLIELFPFVQTALGSPSPAALVPTRAALPAPKPLNDVLEVKAATSDTNGGRNLLNQLLLVTAKEGEAAPLLVEGSAKPMKVPELKPPSFEDIEL